MKAKLAYLFAALIFLILGFGVLKSNVGVNTNASETVSNNIHDKPRLNTDTNKKQVGNDFFKDLISYNKILKEVTPANASQMIDEFYVSTTDINKRANFASLMIIKLCQKGYSDEAYNLIDPSYGDIRRDQLLAFFEKAEMDESKLFDLLGKKSVKGDLKNSLFGFLRRYKPQELEKVLSSSGMKKILEDSNKSGELLDLNNAITSSFARPDSDYLTNVNVVLNLNSKGLLDLKSVMSVVGINSPEKAFEKWNLVKNLTTDSEKDQAGLRNSKETLIRNMVKTDAQKAMRELLGGSLENMETIKDIRAAIGIWSQVDAQGGYNWYMNNKTHYSQKQQSVIAASFSSEAYAAGEFDVARQWINEIQDPEAKASGLKALEERLHPTTK